MGILLVVEAGLFLCEVAMSGYRKSYTLLSVTPTTDFVAVYADKETGELWSDSIDAIGVAQVERKKYVWYDGSRPPKVVEGPHYGSEVVALELSEGGWHICNEAYNYCGMCRRGADIRKVTWSMHRDIENSLKPEFRDPDTVEP